MKDFISATGMVILFQYINFMYLDLFKSSNFDNFAYNEKLALAESNIEIYRSFNYLGSLFSATLLFHLITKVIFNIVAEVKLPLDLWTFVDIFCAFLNIVCF